MQKEQKSISLELLSQLRDEFESSPRYKLMQNAIANVTVDSVALTRDIVANTPHSFSTKLDDWSVTNQKKSGRCWIFAGLNLFRVGAMKKMKLKNFEFSQNYTMFWDKFERANYFLEAIIDTVSSDISERTVAHLLTRPLDDGGQWNMFASIIQKYGVVPQELMPETESSSATGKMNSILVHKLREGASVIRSIASQGSSPEALQTAKHEYLQVIHRILCIHLGTPPEKFMWQWTDKDDEFHRDGVLTPQQFAEKYITIPYQDYVCVVNDTRSSSPFERTYTVKFLGNVIGGNKVIYLNVDIDTIKSLAQNQLVSGEPVWFGCDVGPMMDRKLGLWDAHLYNYGDVYDTDFVMDKEKRLFYHQTQMTHAMLFTGVDVVDGKPVKWRVENSWGDETGVKGYYLMNDSWFDEFMFEIAIPKSALPDNLKAALEIEPTVLPPWDPMGSLAR